MKLNRILMLAILFSISLGSFAQYQTSGILNTPVSSSDELTSVGGWSPPDPERGGKYYAISSQYYLGSKSYRDLRIFAGGTLVGHQPRYSHYHGRNTKVVFHPSDPTILFAMFQELVDPDDPFSGYRTYVKRFDFTPPSQLGGMGTVSQSNRFEVFSHLATADMVIAPNGDLLVGIVGDDHILVRAIRYTTGFQFLTNAAWNVSDNPWGLGNTSFSMDMKGYDWAFVNNKNNGTHLEWASYVPSFPAQAPTTATVFIEEKYAWAGNYGNGSGETQCIGLRPDGSVFLLLMDLPNASPWKLVKYEQNGNATQLGSGDRHANLVASENGQCWLAHQNNGAYQIDLYSMYDQLEHTYDVASPLDNDVNAPNGAALNNLAVSDCDLLACGQINGSTQNHEIYNCSDCWPEAGTTVNCVMDGVIHHNESWQTYYGPTVIPIYCTMNNVVVDGSASTCETGYWVSVRPIDVATWVMGPSLYTGWVSTTNPAPHNLNLGALLGPGPFAKETNYHVTFVVSDGNGGWYPCYKLFRLENCKLLPKLDQNDEDIITLDGIHEESIQAFVFPNPSNGLIQIKMTDPTLNTTYRVMDMAGKEIANGAFTGQVQLQLESQLSTGIYLIRIENSKGVQTEKLYIK